MAVQSNPDQLVGILRDTVVALVRRIYRRASSACS
jgi:hypothetical protein